MKEKILNQIRDKMGYIAIGGVILIASIIAVIFLVGKNNGEEPANDETTRKQQTVITEENTQEDYSSEKNTEENTDKNTNENTEENADEINDETTDRAAEENTQNTTENNSQSTTQNTTQKTTEKNTEQGTEGSTEETKKSGGVLLGNESIEYIKTAISQHKSPNYETWQALLVSPFSNATWIPRSVETVIRGGNGDNVARLYIDVARAYQCALIWSINGSEAHGNAACRILNSWSQNLKVVTGNADRYLAAGLFGYQLANTAELMKNHPAFNVKQMEDMLLNVFYYPLNERFLMGNQYGYDHNDAYVSNYWANWDLCNLASAMAIGIFCQEEKIYNKAVEYYKSGLGNGSIYNAIPYVYQDGTAQWQESGRDQGHTNLGLGLMASICEMAWNHGDDLYGMSDNRLLKAAEYIAKYNNGEEVTFSEYEWGSGRNGAIQYHFVVSQAGRGEVRPIWNMIYNHYVNRMGLTATNVKKRLDIIGYEYGAVSGGHATTYDQPGWGSLTYAGNNTVTGAKPIEGNIQNGVYRIVSVHTGKALSVNENGQLCQRTKENSQHQQWRLTYVGGGEYKIENISTGKAMTIDGCSYGNGAIITTDTYGGKINQKFALLTADSNNYRIIASNSGKAIDIKDWSSDDGAVIFQWRYVMGNNQKWYIEKIK